MRRRSPAPSGGNYESLAVSAVPAVTVGHDDVDTTTVSLGGDGGAAEGGTITYTASVGAPVTGSDVTVTLVEWPDDHDPGGQLEGLGERGGGR